MPLTEEQRQKIRNKFNLSGQQKTTTFAERRKANQVQSIAPESTQSIAPEGTFEEPQGLLSRIGGQLKERGQNIIDIFGKTFRQEITPIEASTQVVGQAGAGVTDVGGELLTTGFKKGAEITRPIDEQIQKVHPIKKEDILNSRVSKLGLNALNRGAEEYQVFKKNNPRAAANLEAVVNIGLILPEAQAAKGLLTASKVASKATKPILRGTTKKLESNLVKQISEEAIDITRPKFTPKEKQLALEAGRGKQKFGQITIQPSKADKLIAQSVEDVVSTRKNSTQNIKAINDKIAKVAKETESGLATNKQGFNQNQLRSFLNNVKEESRVVFGTEKSLENSYDAVISEFLKVQGKHPKNIGGALAARKEFDAIMKRKFPNVFNKFGGDTVRQNAILDVRRGSSHQQLTSSRKKGVVLEFRFPVKIRILI